MSKTSAQRKEASIAFLKSKEILVFEGLPMIEEADDVVLRSKEDVAKRAAALLVCAVYAECVCSDMDLAEAMQMQENIKARFGAHQFFTARETFFLLNSNPDKHTAVQFSWQYERLNVMLWALGLVDELTYPDNICDVPKIVSVMRDIGGFDGLLAASRLRTKDEILDQADLIYRYNWACVDARINNKPALSIDSGVVVERHHALNWLIGYMNQDWDDVSTDT